ncbi:NmrA/HSCARG family protein [Actinoplanes utahensis]|uniref:NmrA-like domain-containing protein n=1 Tax=Actinoplanes utahensis TaxID=1869 RepID=A0A0A6X3Z5_ACTUT|nr:NmrA/HSCARG family protein [Actinoplanes utahensis]KHD74797.1 hypothetical protein MB27_26565 [Actinoplanes utahensis]GIF35190.1 nucleotide-diphosphate-sugar epimerase [Actinoplanes utahensis]
MSAKRIITVLGATGAQGGSVVRAIAADPTSGFTVRAVTRDRAKAEDLLAAGIEVVEADLDDEASLRRALDGAHGAFVVTNWWEPPAAGSAWTSRTEREQGQAANAARAAAATGLRHVIWSTLADTRSYLPDAPRQEAGYTVPHADGKAEANAFFLDAEVPTTFVTAPMYYESLFTFNAPRRTQDGTLVLAMPIGSARVVSGTVDDVGRIAYAIFNRGDALVGRTVPIASDLCSGEDFAAGVADALGEPVHYVPVDPAALAHSGMPDAGELANMFQYFVNAEKDLTQIDFNWLRDLNPGLQPFTTWASANRHRFRALDL